MLGTANVLQHNRTVPVARRRTGKKRCFSLAALVAPVLRRDPSTATETQVVAPVLHKFLPRPYLLQRIAPSAPVRAGVIVASHDMIVAFLPRVGSGRRRVRGGRPGTARGAARGTARCAARDAREQGRAAHQARFLERFLNRSRFKGCHVRPLGQRRRGRPLGGRGRTRARTARARHDGDYTRGRVGTIYSILLRVRLCRRGSKNYNMYENACKTGLV